MRVVITALILRATGLDGPLEAALSTGNRGVARRVRGPLLVSLIDSRRTYAALH